MSMTSRAVTRGFAGLIAGVVLVAWGSPSWAHNLSFLNDTPLTYMKKEDRQALNSAAQVALNTKQDGESLAWSNAGTGNPVSIKGTVTPRDTTKQGDVTCRHVTLVANAKGQSQSWTPNVCRTGSGEWKIQKK